MLGYDDAALRVFADRVHRVVRPGSDVLVKGGDSRLSAFGRGGSLLLASVYRPSLALLPAFLYLPALLWGGPAEGHAVAALKARPKVRFSAPFRSRSQKLRGAKCPS